MGDVTDGAVSHVACVPPPPNPKPVYREVKSNDEVKPVNELLLVRSASRRLNMTKNVTVV
jgi:hypothetical protein